MLSFSQLDGIFLGGVAELQAQSRTPAALSLPNLFLSAWLLTSKHRP